MKHRITLIETREILFDIEADSFEAAGVLLLEQCELENEPGEIYHENIQYVSETDIEQTIGPPADVE